MSMHLRGSRDIMRNEDETWWQARTGLEQKLIILSVLLFIVAFSLVITVIVLNKRLASGSTGDTTIAPTTDSITGSGEETTLTEALSTVSGGETSKATAETSKATAETSEATAETSKPTEAPTTKTETTSPGGSTKPAEQTTVKPAEQTTVKPAENTAELFEPKLNYEAARESRDASKLIELMQFAAGA